jgi:Domain of unknown function(DUF2779)
MGGSIACSMCWTSSRTKAWRSGWRASSGRSTSSTCCPIAELLSKHIAPGGSVVVWHAPFERGVNAEIAKRRPEYARAMERINAQLIDFRDIFADQLYVHPNFRGSTSIKAVLPVLCPELSYQGLAIKEGATASNEWWRMIWPVASQVEKKEIAKALREYCALDSYAMYAIWRALQQVAA